METKINCSHCMETKIKCCLCVYSKYWAQEIDVIDNNGKDIENLPKELEYLLEYKEELSCCYEPPKIFFLKNGKPLGVFPVVNENMFCSKFHQAVKGDNQQGRNLFINREVFDEM